LLCIFYLFFFLMWKHSTLYIKKLLSFLDFWYRSNVLKLKEVKSHARKKYYTGSLSFFSLCFFFLFCFFWIIILFLPENFSFIACNADYFCFILNNNVHMRWGLSKNIIAVRRFFFLYNKKYYIDFIFFFVFLQRQLSKEL